MRQYLVCMIQKKVLRTALCALILLCALLSICLLPPIAQPTVARAESKTPYAYLPADTVLYRLDGETYSPVVMLPATYFVALLASPQGAYYAVSYLDITGFVSADSVEVCDYTPVTAYCTRGARPKNDTLPINLRDIADHNSGNILATVPDGTALTLYGSLSGTALIPAVGEQWYYVCYRSGESNTWGYVYGGHTEVDALIPNVVEKMPETPITPPDTSVEESTTVLSPRLQIIFIIALSVPAVVIMLLLFRKNPNKKTKVPRGQNP